MPSLFLLGPFLQPATPLPATHRAATPRPMGQPRAAARSAGRLVAGRRLSLATAGLSLWLAVAMSSTAAVAAQPDAAAADGQVAAAALADGAALAEGAGNSIVVGNGPGWVTLGEDDFVPVNGYPETWSFPDGQIHTTGKPIGVMRTKKMYGNFELVVHWRHMESGGNSGIFAWVTDEGLAGLVPDQLPHNGIEIQMLDHGYRDQYEARSGRIGDWFTTHGDVFAVGKSKMKPFPPLSPNGSRSFPRHERSLGAGQWNHYYVRGVQGEIRLWVNGVEVSGGSGCDPSRGYLCLEAEGAPVEFRGLRVRELP